MHSRLSKVLPVHPTARHRDGTPLQAIGIVSGKPVWPVQGGAPDDDDAAKKAADDKAAADKAAADKAAADKAAADAKKAQDDGDKGFPDNTPVEQMTDRQAAAYWKFHSRKHEDTAKARSDYDAVKAKADQYDALAKASMTEQERAIDAAKAETRTELAADAAGQRLVGLLVSRGKSEAEADEIVEDLNLARYVKDGKPDRDAIAKAVDRLAGPAGEGGSSFPDLGQGKRKTGRASGADAGRAEAERRFGKTKQ